MAFCQVLSSQLSMEAMSFVTEDRKTAQESTFPNTYTFDLFGGVDVSLTFLVPNALLLTLELVTCGESVIICSTTHTETL